MTHQKKPFEPELTSTIDKYHAGDHEGALVDLRRLASVYPEAAAVHGFLAGFLFMDGNYELALPHARRAVELAPTKPVPARELILTLFHLGRFKEARDEIIRSQSHLCDDEDLSEWKHLLSTVDGALRRSGQGA